MFLQKIKGIGDYINSEILLSKKSECRIYFDLSYVLEKAVAEFTS